MKPPYLNSPPCLARLLSEIAKLSDIDLAEITGTTVRLNVYRGIARVTVIRDGCKAHYDGKDLKTLFGT